MRRILAVAALALTLVLTPLAQPSLAAEFYAVVDTFGKRARNAYIDVGTDTAAGRVEVLFNVFDTNGGQITEFWLTGNDSGFVSTASFGNLFDLAGGAPMLVRVRTPENIAASTATLYVDSQGAPMITGLIPVRRMADGAGLAQGTHFQLPLGNFRSASLPIANVSGVAQAVDIHKGTRGGTGTGSYSNPSLSTHSIWRVDLTQNEALSNLVVTSTGPIIVQAVINDGRTTQSFMVLPVL